jgi:hypothetical protein
MAPIRARELAPLMAVGGGLALIFAILSLCALKGQTMAECDRDKQIPLLVLGLTSTVFGWLSNPPR